VNEWFDDVRLEVIPNCGHFVSVQAPDVFANAATSFFAREFLKTEPRARGGPLLHAL